MRESLHPDRSGALSGQSKLRFGCLPSFWKREEERKHRVYSFSVRVGFLLSSTFLLAVHYVSGISWSDFSLVLPLAVGSFAAGSAAARLVNFGFRGKNAPLGHNALIVGASCYEDLYQRIGRHTVARPVGYLFSDESGRLLFRNEAGEETPSTLDQVLDANVIDDVLLVDSIKGLDPDDILYSTSIRGKTFQTLMRTPLAPAGRYRTLDLGAGEYLLTHESVPLGKVQLAVKRLMDIVGASFGLVVCGIAYLAFSRRIQRETGGSTIFRQIRVGRNGRLFTLYKFRTMQVTAEDRQEELLKLNEMSGHIFKIRDDPRITPLGRLLRKRYIDELPQFWNAFKGDMSLVGTRPPMVSEFASYEPHHQRRLSMKPGITGLWQLNGHDEVADFETIVKLDCNYIDNWSLWQDCKIIFRTILRVTQGGGY